MAVTVKDVAKLAGVSPSTVSRVSHGNPTISQETRELVYRAMEQLGFELPAKPESNNAGSLKTIGIILPPSDKEAYENTFYLKAIRGISLICNQHQVATTIVTGRDYEEILHSIQILHHSSSLDGFILLYSRKNDIVIDYLCTQGLLYVIIGKEDELAGKTVSIDNDNCLAGRDATDYLYSLGHRRIGYICNDSDFQYTEDRRAGYQLSHLLHQLPIRDDYCVKLDGLYHAKSTSLRELLRKSDRPTAFVVSDDILALALERICHQEQLRIPEDISIIAFNNSLYAQLTSPQLTAVDIGAFQLGQQAAVHLISHANNPKLEATRTIVPHKIIERDSCRKIDLR